MENQTMNDCDFFAHITGPIVMIGFGAIGRATLPLILRHLDIDRSRMTIVDPDDRNREVADAAGIRFIQQAVTTANMRQLVGPLLAGPGQGFLVNVSVEVCSMELIKMCRDLGCLYIDTCIEPEPGGYTDRSKSMASRTNYAMREAALGLRRPMMNDPTAIVGHGANPGMVSHLVKRALQQLALDQTGQKVAPQSPQEWAMLARDLGVQGIHIAERDTQRSAIPKRMGEFVNTWSVDGFLSEGVQPAELGWGTHERALPAQGREHTAGCGAAIYLTRPGAATRVRSWTPASGPMIGYLITHNEAISIADFLTVREDGQAVYRPTCHYAYHPCDDAILSLHELQGRAFQEQTEKRILNDDIVEGMDELGVLLYGHAGNALWYGSQLSFKEARDLAPYNSATTLQVTSSIVAAMAWAVENPHAGIIEAEQMDHDRVLNLMTPYLGDVVGVYTSWTPIQDRARSLFDEDIDASHPWQFSNVLVA